MFYDNITDIQSKICLSIEEYTEKCKHINKKVVNYKKNIYKTFNHLRETEQLTCSNLKRNVQQQQLALEDLVVEHDRSSIFPINSVIYANSSCLLTCRN